MPYLLCDSETGSIEGPLQPHPLGTRLGGVLRCATNGLIETKRNETKYMAEGEKMLINLNTA